MIYILLSRDFIQELKSKNDIYDIISEYVDLKKSGVNFMGLCPFHSEKTPSFCVYPNSESFYCFGCGLGGDVITFIQLAEKFNYMESVEFLAKKSGMNVPENVYDNDQYNNKMIIYELNREAARFYHQILMSEKNRHALQYLLSRGLAIKTIRHFGLGYAPNARNLLFNYLKNKGYDAKYILQANLAVIRQNGNISDRFWNRIMFPIIDLRGNVVAFGGRVLDNGMPKYLNTSDTIVFKKSDNLFALNFAKNYSAKQMILAEGYMDVISLHQAGFTNTVASLGTSITAEQVKLISRYANEVVISYDSDNAGIKATNRAINMFQDNGINVKILKIPNGKDPDEFMKIYKNDGQARFQVLIDSSKNYMDYQINTLKDNFDLKKSENKVKYLKEVSKLLANVNNKIEREVYANKLSEEMGIEKSTLLSEIDRYIKRVSKKMPKDELKFIKHNLSFDVLQPKNSVDINIRSRNVEDLLLSFIINNQDMANNIFLKVSDDMFLNEFNKKLYKIIKSMIFQGISLDNLTDLISKDDFSFAEIGKITNLCCNYVKSDDSIKLLNEYISVMKQEYLKNKFQNITDINESSIKDYINSLKTLKG